MFFIANRIARARCVLLAMVLCAVAASPAVARGPDAIADVAEKVIDAVVNISTSQTIEAKGAMPNLPPGSPFEEFFEEFFKNNRRPGQQGPQGPQRDQGQQGQQGRKVSKVSKVSKVRTTIRGVRRAGSIRLDRASSSIRRASWSPTIM